MPGTFLYKNRFELNAALGSGTLVNGPLLTDLVAANNEGSSEEIEVLRNKLVSRKQFVTVVNVSEEELKKHVNLRSAELAGFVKDSDWTLQAEGIEMNFDTPSPAFLLSPMNYDLKPTGYLDGEKTDVLRANGAMAGVFVPAGKHTVVLHVDHDWYTIAALLQVALLVSLVGLFWWGGRRPRSQGPSSPADANIAMQDAALGEGMKSPGNKLLPGAGVATLNDVTSMAHLGTG